MKGKFLSSSILSALLLLTACAKKPTACINASSDSVQKNQSISIDGFCSQNAKWYVYDVDGTGFSGTTSDFDYTFTTVGQHTIKLTVYSNFNGTYNSQSGVCSGCSGSGKSNSTSKVITVAN